MTILSKNPAQYGLDDITPEPAEKYEVVNVDYPVDLRLVAECVDAPVEQLVDLNPSLLRRFFGTDTIPEGKGLVHIRTIPEGATIVVDGKAAPKKTNARWPADPGVYSIVLQLSGYKQVHRNVRVQKGKVVNIDEPLEKQ